MTKPAQALEKRLYIIKLKFVQGLNRNQIMERLGINKTIYDDAIRKYKKGIIKLP